MTDLEMEQVIDLAKMRSAYTHIVDQLREDYVKNLSLRTAVGKQFFFFPAVMSCLASHGGTSLARQVAYEELA